MPRAGELIGQIDQLTRRGAEPSQLLLQGTQGLTGKVERLIPTAEDLVRLSRVLDEFRNGGAQLADTLSGATSVNDNGGTYGQVDVLEFEDPKPENVGLPAAAARSRAGRPSVLDRKLALALERTCKRNEVACLLRFMVPGLPTEPLTAGRGDG